MQYISVIVSNPIQFKICPAASRVTALVTAAVTLALAGCAPRSEREVTGVYELNTGSQKIILDLHPDHSFQETIRFSSGQVNKLAGRWSWMGGGVDFDSLWIPPSFAPDYILQADAEAATTGQHKYTERGHWSGTAESRWGKVVLPIFPDSDISFQMVRHVNR